MNPSQHMLQRQTSGGMTGCRCRHFPYPTFLPGQRELAESGVVDAIGALQSTVSALFLWQRQALQGVFVGGVLGWMKLEQQTLVTRTRNIKY